MDNVAKLKDALRLRMHGNPDEYYEESVWKEEVDAICEDIPAVINFILSECTDEELRWLSEVFDDVMDKTLTRKNGARANFRIWSRKAIPCWERSFPS